MTIIKTKPIILDTPGFDAEKDFTIRYKWSGSFKISKTYMYIYVSENDQRELIGNKPNEITIPANFLENCRDPYKIKIYVSDGNNQSEYSDEKVIYCNTSPYILFQNISTILNDQKINSYIYYNQAENIEAKYYKYKLYDENNQLIDESDELYSLTKGEYEIGYYTVPYKYDGLENGKNYSLKILGETVNNMPFEATKYFVVKYSTSSSTDDIEIYQPPNGNVNIRASVKPVSYTHTGHLNYNHHSDDPNKTILCLDSSSHVKYNFDSKIKTNFVITSKLYCLPDKNNDRLIYTLDCEETYINIYQLLKYKNSYYRVVEKGTPGAGKNGTTFKEDGKYKIILDEGSILILKVLKVTGEPFEYDGNYYVQDETYDGIYLQLIQRNKNDDSNLLVINSNVIHAWQYDEYFMEIKNNSYGWSIHIENIEEG